MKKSATLFLEDVETNEEGYHAGAGRTNSRQDVLLPGGMRMGVGNALMDKDGCVEGWLD